MNYLWNPDDQSELGTTNGKLCSFQFADLHHSGTLSLVANYDGGGTEDCNEIAIFDKTSSGFEEYDIHGYADFAPGFRSDIRDLDRDGKLELVVNKVFAISTTRGHCGAEWPVIFAWTGSAYNDVSGHFKGYYERKLASLEARAAAHLPETQQSQSFTIEQPSAGGSSLGDEQQQGPRFEVRIEPNVFFPATAEHIDLDNDCREATIAKLKRYLGISRDAGMADAIKWAESDDPLRREFAAQVFRDIATPEAHEYLLTLSHDSDRNVAIEAKEDLADMSRGPLRYRMSRETYDLPPGGPHP